MGVPVCIHKERLAGITEPVCALVLDIDGVLNRVTTGSRGVLPRKPGLPLEWVVGIDPELAVLLNGVNRANLVVIIASSWRVAHGLDQTEDALNRAGYTGMVVGATPNLGNRRDQEIQEFLDVWKAQKDLPPIASIAILDDCDPESMGHLKTRLVQTDPMNGLNAEDVQKVRVLLG